MSNFAFLTTEWKNIHEAVTKAESAATPDDHDYSEAEIRDYFIDLLLKEAGWPLNQTHDREFPVTGMPSNNAPNNLGCMPIVWS